MSFLSSCISVLLTLLFFCVLAFSQQRTPIPTPQQIETKGDIPPITPAFAKLLERSGIFTSSNSVTVAPVTAEANPQIVDGINGEHLVLSFPVEITNSSLRPISMALSHEWYGGIPPQTDLQMAVMKKGQTGMVWDVGPGYQVGAIGDIDETLLQPGETKRLDIRLNWPGTGSCPSEPLIDALKSGKYNGKLLLLFRSDGVQQYVESPVFELQVTDYNELFAVIFSTDDKAPTEMFHTVVRLSLTHTKQQMTRYVHSWAVQGGSRPDSNTKTKAEECIRILKSIDQPKILPESPNKIVTVRGLDGGNLVSKKFPIDHVPAEIYQIITIMGFRDDNQLKRLTFIQD